MALGVGVIFVGYWIGLFGYASLRGPGVGFVDLIVPGRNVQWPNPPTSSNPDPTRIAGGSGSGITDLSPGNHFPGWVPPGQTAAP